ncbi:MAG TPA: MFS transporter [Thermoleophilaceae bacterium]|nr:MFS transporter [Thermoleophilaceae bacterium]
MRRLFWLVCAVLVIDTAFYAAITPLLPTYAEDLDLSKTAAGVLSASYAAGTLAGALPGGSLAVRFGVKPALLTGLSLLAVTSAVFGVAENVVILDAARFFQGVGGACSWAAGLAWLVGAAPRERRGQLIGGAIGAAIVGLFFGPVIGGAAVALGTEPVFGAAAAFAAGLGAWALVTSAHEAGAEAGLRGLAAAMRVHPDLRTGFLLFILPALFAGVVAVLVPLRLDALGAGGVAVGAAFLAAAAVEATVSPLAGRASDRRGRLAPMRAGLAAAAVAGLLLAVPENALLLTVLLCATAGALGTFWAPAMALLTDAADSAGVGHAMAIAIANLAWAIGQVVGGAAGSGLADLTADALPYTLLSALCLLALLTVARKPGGGPAYRPRIEREQAGQGLVP